MHHELKIHPQYFAAVLSGSKRFEVRQNDRDFQMGDSLTLLEWDPRAASFEAGFTGRQLACVIGYVYYLEDRRVVFSLLELPGG